MISAIIAAIETPEDRDFIISLYQDYYLLMFATAKEYFPSQSDREDVVQTSLESLIRNIDTLRALSRCTLVSYIVITIRNTSYNLLKRNKRDADLFVKMEHNPEVDELAAKLSADEMFMLIHRKNLLSRIWDQLSAEDRFLLNGKYVVGCSDQELAASLNCKPSSIRMKLTRARRRALTLSKELEV